MKMKKFNKRVLKKSCIASVIILLILIIIPWYALSLFLNQRYYQPQFNATDFGIEVEQITLMTADELNLASWRVFTEGEPYGTVVIVSGIQYPSVTAFFGYAQMLAENGWDSLLIEKRARSLSEGESIGLAITEWMDVEAGVNFLNDDARVGDLPIITMGTSAGGSAVLVAGSEVPRIDGVIAISAFTTFTDVYVDNMPMVGLPRFIGHLTRPFMWLQLGFRFGFDEINRTPMGALEHFSEQPLLLMHSTDDWQVPFSHFENLYERAREVGVDIYTFTRTGNWHFVVYDRYIQTPAEDDEFSHALFEFLAIFQ